MRSNCAHSLAHNDNDDGSITATPKTTTTTSVPSIVRMCNLWYSMYYIDAKRDDNDDDQKRRRKAFEERTACRSSPPHVVVVVGVAPHTHHVLYVKSLCGYVCLREYGLSVILCYSEHAFSLFLSPSHNVENTMRYDTIRWENQS